MDIFRDMLWSGGCLHARAAADLRRELPRRHQDQRARAFGLREHLVRVAGEQAVHLAPSAVKKDLRPTDANALRFRPKLWECKAGLTTFKRVSMCCFVETA